MYDSRTNLAREVESEVRNFFRGRERVFDAKIPRSIRLAEAPSHGLPISHYAPGSLGALAYSDLAEEIITSTDRPTVPIQDLAKIRERKSDPTDETSQEAYPS
jgi:chromosome partitioning protein